MSYRTRSRDVLQRSSLSPCFYLIRCLPSSSPTLLARMADFTDTRTASEGRVLAGLLALAALYVVALGWQFRDAVVDDAYIGLVFLRNLLAGQGFVFHASSMPVEGMSNIGWIL